MYPPAVFNLPFAASEIVVELRPSSLAASEAEKYSAILFPCLSYCSTGLQNRTLLFFSVNCLYVSVPFLSSNVLFLFSIASFVMVFPKWEMDIRRLVIGLRLFSLGVHHRRFSTLLSFLTQLMWSIKGRLAGLGMNASATRRWMFLGNFIPSFTRITRAYQPPANVGDSIFPDIRPVRPSE